MTKAVRVLIALICHSVIASTAMSADYSAWEKAYNPATGTRFIPVEL